MQQEIVFDHEELKLVSVLGCLIRHISNLLLEHTRCPSIRVKENGVSVTVKDVLTRQSWHKTGVFLPALNHASGVNVKKVALFLPIGPRCWKRGAGKINLGGYSVNKTQNLPVCDTSKDARVGIGLPTVSFLDLIGLRIRCLSRVFQFHHGCALGTGLISRFRRFTEVPSLICIADRACGKVKLRLAVLAFKRGCLNSNLPRHIRVFIRRLGCVLRSGGSHIGDYIKDLRFRPTSDRAIFGG